MIKKILPLVFVLLLMPLVFANVVVECTPLSVSSGATITCNVKTDAAISNVGALDLKVNPGSHTATAATSSVGTGFLNTNSASPQYNSAGFIAGSGVNFNANGVLAVLTLTAGSSSSAVSLVSLALTDYDAYTSIAYGSLTPSSTITVSPTGCSTDNDCNGLSCISVGGGVKKCKEVDVRVDDLKPIIKGEGTSAGLTVLQRLARIASILRALFS